MIREVFTNIIHSNTNKAFETENLIAYNLHTEKKYK